MLKTSTTALHSNPNKEKLEKEKAGGGRSLSVFVLDKSKTILRLKEDVLVFRWTSHLQTHGRLKGFVMWSNINTELCKNQMFDITTIIKLAVNMIIIAIIIIIN